MKHTLLKIGARGTDGIPLLLWFIAERERGEGEGKGRGGKLFENCVQVFKMRITIC